MKNLIIAKVIAALLLSTSLAQAQTLMGSAASMEKQYQLARTYGFKFVNTASEVQGNINSRQLVRVNPDRYIELHDVSYPYAVSETKLFLDRLSAQYYSACGEKLTVTSLLRPRNRQPSNASARSVHPTGMAADLRIPAKRSCRTWLENTLLSLEKERVLDVTRERYPPHYHVAVYAKHYETRVAAIYGSNYGQPVTELRSQPERNVIEVAEVTEVAEITQVAEITRVTESTRSAARSVAQQSYLVRKGDSLSEIADRTGVSVPQLRAANGLRGNVINAGQKLSIPTTGKGAGTAATQGYVVRKGDSLSEIADRTGVSVSQLRSANGLRRSNIINPGQTLRIPATGKAAATTASQNLVAVNDITHRVHRGDTLWTIANRYGTSVKKLRQSNSKAGDSLQVGQVIKISRG